MKARYHPLRTCVAASASVPWIYMAQFWYTLKMDQSKFKFKFVLNTKELPMTVADFICIFQLPQATDNNHAGFVDAPTFSQMVPFCHNALGFSLTLRPSSNFVSKGLPHSWQTLCKIFTRCLTTRVTGHDQPPVQIIRQDPESPIPIAAEIDVTNLDETIQMSECAYSSSDKETLQELTITTEDAHSSLDKEKLRELTVTNTTPSPSSPKPKTGRFRHYKTFIQQMGGRYGYMFAHLKKHFLPRKKFHQLAKHLHSIMEEFLPSMVGDRVNEIAKKTTPLYVAEGLLLDKQKTQADVATMIAEAVDSFLRNYMANNILHVHPNQAHASSAQDIQYQLYQMMKND
ncbi:hypothetical protein Tco_1020586 [Tanacetum coccineum]